MLCVCERPGYDAAPDESHGSEYPLISPKMAGITINVKNVEETMPPIIGTKVLCMISEPVPVLDMIDSNPP